MTFASFQVLFAGPSPGIVLGILAVACGAAGVVLWMLIRLVVDPRAGAAQQREQRDESTAVQWDEANDPAYDDGYALTRRDETG